MSKEIELEITATGGVQMLADDSLDLRDMGEVKTKRASHVEFDNDKQCWFVQSAKTLEILKDGFSNRGEALAWEKEYYSPSGKGWDELTQEDV